MKYFVDGFTFPLNIEEAKVKSALHDRLSIGVRSFRYEPCFKRVRYSVSKKKPLLECAFSVETTSYVKDTSISFLPELAEPDYKKIECPNGVAVVGDDYCALLFALVLAKQNIKTTLMVPSDMIDKKRRLSGSYIYFPKPKGSEDSELILREMLKDKVGIRGGFVPLSGKDHSVLIDRLIAEFTKRGGTLLYNSYPIYGAFFLGKLRKLFYMDGEYERANKFDRLIMLDQGQTGSFYQTMKAKKTKSDPRLRIYIESKKKDTDLLFYENQLRLPLAFSSYAFSSKNGGKVYVRYPLAEATLRNYALNSSDPQLGLVFNPERRKTTVLTSLEVSLKSMEDLKSTLASCKRYNLPSCVPCQKVTDFLMRKESFRLGGVKSSYAEGVYLDNFHSLLPTDAADSFQNAIWRIKEDVPYLSSDAIIIGAEAVIYPGEVVIPSRYASFVKPYWNRSADELDLVSQGDFVFESLKDFFGYS